MVIKLYCPKNLDIDAVVKANPFVKGKGLKKDGLLFIIHSIMIQRANRDDAHLKKLGKVNGFVPLHSKVLEEKIPKYHAHIEYLISCGIIECDESYIIDVVSMGYRLADAYRYQDFKMIPVSDYVLNRKINADLRSNRYLGGTQLPNLTKWFKMGKLEIDAVGAYQWINDYEQQNINSIHSTKGYSKLWKVEEMEKINETCKSFKLLVNRIYEKDYYCSFDDTGHRMHTNLTNLPKGLRQFITFDGNPMISVDIKNSQPYMSLPLLTKEFWQSKEPTQKPSLRKIDDRQWEKVRKERERGNNIIKFLETSKTLTQTDFQKYEFIKNACSGTFYEYLIPVFENEGVLKPNLNHLEKREKVKKIVLTLLFDDDNKSYNRHQSSPSQVFKRKFPTIAKVFEFIKSDDYRNLAIILQRIESHLVLHKICGRITREMPHIPLFTIHDSLVTTVGNERYVNEIMEEELTKAIGLPPQFSVECWGFKTKPIDNELVGNGFVLDISKCKLLI